MARTGTTPDGRKWLINPDETWTEISDEDYNAVKGSGFVDSALNRAQTIGYGLFNTLAGMRSGGLTDEGGIYSGFRDYTEQRAEELLRQKEMMSSGGDLSTQLGPVAPDAALALMTRNPYAGAALDAGIGAVTAPPGKGLQGAVVSGAAGLAGGMLGQFATNYARGARTTREVLGLPKKVDRGLMPGRPVNAAPTPVSEINLAGTDKVLRGAATSTEMLERDFPLSHAQGRILDATDPEDFVSARDLDRAEWQRSRTQDTLTQRVFTGKPIDYGQLRREQQTALNRNVAAEIGDPNASVIDKKTVNEALVATGKELDDISARGGPVDVGADMARGEASIPDQIHELITEGSLEDVPVGRTLTKLADRIEKQRTGRTITPEEMNSHINRLRKQMEQAYRNNPDLEAGDALSDALGILQQRRRAGWSQDLINDEKAALRQWGISKALLRNKAVLSARGDVNVESFETALRTADNLFRLGYRDTDPFYRFLNGARAAMMKEGPEGGTPAGMAPLILDAVRKIPGVP